MRMGQATMRPVIELDLIHTPAGAFVDGLATADLGPHLDWLAPQYFDVAADQCNLSHHAWLIELDGKRIVVDPCIGHDRDRPALPFFHRVQSRFLERLRALGAEPESIDYVFCTHLHLDHVGWNTRLENGRYVPTFPNARYLFSRAEDAYWRQELTGTLPPGDMQFNGGVYAECIAPIIAAGLADIVEGETRVMPEFTLIEAAGHTIGHMAGLLESAGAGAVLCGDAIHHPVQVLFAHRLGHGHDREQARASRLRLLDLCADRDYWLAPAHFRAPHVCKIRHSGGGYRMLWGPAPVPKAA